MQFRQVVEALSAESAEIRVTNHLQIQIQREIYFRGATHALIALISLIKTTLWGWNSGCCSLVFYEWKLLARANSERSGMTYTTTTTIYAFLLLEHYAIKRVGGFCVILFWWSASWSDEWWKWSTLGVGTSMTMEINGATVNAFDLKFSQLLITISIRLCLNLNFVQWS